MSSAPVIRWAGAILLLCIAGVGRAVTVLETQSEPGEPLFDGQNGTFAGDWTFETSYDPAASAIEVHLSRPASPTVDLLFAARPGDTLIGPEHFDVEIPAGAPDATVRVDANDRRCFIGGEGNFRIAELEAQAGVIAKLALDFQFRCSGTQGVLRGQLRIDSTVPTVATLPVAVAQVQRYADEGDPVTLNAGWSRPGSEPIDSYSWQQLSGPAVTLSDSNAPRPTFVAAAAPGQLSTSVFELTIADTVGRTSTATTELQVYSRTAPQTYVALQSDQAEYVLAGESFLFRAAEQPLTIALTADPGQHEIIIDGPITILVSGPEGRPLGVGNYDDARRFPSPTGAKLSVFGFGRGCNGEIGRFTVYEIEMNATSGALEKLALDFDRRCDSNPDSEARAYGQVRLNSTVPRLRDRPLADAGADQIVGEQSSVALDAVNSRPGPSPIVAWSWTQLSGPAVAIANPTASQTSFVAPVVPAGSGQILLELTVTDSGGKADSDQVLVTVLSASEPRDLMVLDGRQNDYIGRGRLWTLDEYDGNFVARSDRVGALLVGIDAGLDSFDFEFRAPQGEDLTADNYENADRSPAHPGISAGSFGRGCSFPAGRFVIREIVFEPGTRAVLAFAADFVHYCDGQLVALTGAIRYHSSVPIEVNEPTTAAGNDRDVLERSDVVLDGRNTMPGAGTIASWQWRQTQGPSVALRDANQSVARFAVDRLGNVTTTLRFELLATSTNGTQDTDTIDVRVHSRTAPRTFAAFSSPATETLLPSGGIFEARDLQQSRTAVYVNWLAGADEAHFDFFAPAGEDLRVGSYIEDSTNPTGAHFTVYAVTETLLIGCSSISYRGTFQIRDIEFSGTQLTRLAADFEKFCANDPTPVIGKVRFNVPLPDAHAGADQSAPGRGVVTLSAVNSLPAVGGIASYGWRQLSGPNVVLNNASSASATFTAPDVATASTLEFELTVIDDRGLESTDTVVVDVSPAAPSSGGSGGGGGSFDIVLLLALMFISTLRCRLLRSRLAGFEPLSTVGRQVRSRRALVFLDLLRAQHVAPAADRALVDEVREAAVEELLGHAYFAGHVRFQVGEVHEQHVRGLAHIPPGLNVRPKRVGRVAFAGKRAVERLADVARRPAAGAAGRAGPADR